MSKKKKKIPYQKSVYLRASELPEECMGGNVSRRKLRTSTSSTAASSASARHRHNTVPVTMQGAQSWFEVAFGFAEGSYSDVLRSLRMGGRRARVPSREVASAARRALRVRERGGAARSSSSHCCSSTPRRCFPQRRHIVRARSRERDRPPLGPQQRRGPSFRPPVNSTASRWSTRA